MFEIFIVDGIYDVGNAKRRHLLFCCIMFALFYISDTSYNSLLLIDSAAYYINTNKMSSWWGFSALNHGMVGKLQVKTSSHWRNIDRQYWIETCGMEARLLYGVERVMVRLQHALVAAGKCKSGNMILAGEFHGWGFRKRDRRTLKEFYRTPYHEDLLENWGKLFVVLGSRGSMGYMVCLFVLSVY